MFSEKLNFLIDITGVKNSDLAAYASVDASHISRLRTGSRKLSKKQSYVMPMARYFAKHITEPFKRRIVADALHFPGGWPKDNKLTAELIYEWLVSEDDTDTVKSDGFFKGFANAGRTQTPVSETPPEKNFSDSSSFFYYGAEGKQNAVIRFLNDVLNEETPQTLLLFSDEELGWLYEDSAFVKEWTRLLTAVLKKGNRIKIIHTINRDSNEMAEALLRWIPVYMTGSIEPYYYPKLRDGVFQKTMFIAPRTAAVISSSVKMNVENMLNIYIVIPEAVKSLVAEYERYLSLCRPLIDIMNVSNADRYFREISDFENISAPNAVFAPVPSLMTMPESLADVFAAKSPVIKSVWEKSSKQFEMFSEENEFYEIILLPTQDQLAADRIPMPMSDFFRADNLYYTKKQYKEHLQNVLRLTREKPHYHAVINTEFVSDVMVYVKEDVGVIVSKANLPTVVFTMREPNMTAAFWNYILKLIPHPSKDKDVNFAGKIEKIIESLQD